MKRLWMIVALVGWIVGAPGIPTWPPYRAAVAPAVWSATADDQVAEFLVLMQDQPDLTQAARLSDRQLRRAWIYRTLLETAARTQAPLRGWLESQKVSYRSFYIVNMLWVRGDRALVEKLAARSDVARIVANPSVYNELPIVEPATAMMLNQWNLEKIGAPQLWAAGITGQGIVLAGQDTGYDWTHPALQPHYRGWNGGSASHDYNWHDAIHENNSHTGAGNPCGFNATVPCDDHGHGTHTVGTMVGTVPQAEPVGVAPGAQWIGCRNMEEGWGTPATYAECFEFFLAPYPVTGTVAQGNPAYAPDIVSNSWTCPVDEGCDYAVFEQVVMTLRAADIEVVAAAGNAGPGCSTIDEPVGIYASAFTIGSTDNTDTVSGFSGRGPVLVDGSGRIKPDLVAPGSVIYSTLPGGGYGQMSGTSMATPQVAGAIALLWSAVPTLTGRLTETEALLAATALPITTTACSSNGIPNTVYGWGRLDIAAAVNFMISDTGIVAGQVTGAAGEPLVAQLTFSPTVQTGENLAQVVTTSLDGSFIARLQPAVYSLRVAASDYLTHTRTGITVTVGVTESLAISLTYCTPITVAAVTYEPLQPKVGELVVFTAAVTGGLGTLNYRWDFGSGETTVSGITASYRFPLTRTHTHTVHFQAADLCREAGQAVSLSVQAWEFYLPIILRQR